MGQRMRWDEMKKAYPDEWVAVINYTSDECGDVDGEVVAHSRDKGAFYEELNALVPRYHDVAMRYTGERIKNAEIPLLWQISRTA
jgi:hypothetical protein